jgi:GTP cyclohydrolase I
MVKFVDGVTNPKEGPEILTDESAIGSEIEQANGKKRGVGGEGEDGTKKKRKRDRRPKSMRKRRLSLSKAARDPRDEASPVGLDVGTRSPSPLIDFDGLSRPSESREPVHAFTTSTNIL